MKQQVCTLRRRQSKAGKSSLYRAVGPTKPPITNRRSDIRGVRRIQTDRRESCSSRTEAPCFECLSIPCSDWEKLMRTRPVSFLPLGAGLLPPSPDRPTKKASTQSPINNFFNLNFPLPFSGVRPPPIWGPIEDHGNLSSRQTREDKKSVPSYFTRQPAFWLGNRRDPLRVSKMECGYTFREIMWVAESWLPFSEC